MSGMPVVQVEVQVLAEPAQRARDVEHGRQRASHRVLNVRDQLGQPVIRRAEVAQAQPGVAEPELWRTPA